MAYSDGPLTPSDPAADMLRRKEGLRTTAYWDVNHYRTGYGSDTTTDETGAVRPVTPATRITPADANRDLQRREYDTQAGIINDIGVDAWFRLSPDAQAALTDIAYNYGSLKGLPSVVHAAQTGDSSRLAAALAARRGDNGGVNDSRRREEAQMVLAGGEPATEDPPDPTAGSSWSWPKVETKPEPAKAEKPAAPAGGSWSWPKPGEKPAEKKETLWETYKREELAKAKTPEERALREGELATEGGAIGLTSGFLQTFTKLAGFLPNELGGGKAAQATKTLKEMGDPRAMPAGELGGAFVIPAERVVGAIGKGAELLGGGAKVAEEAAPAVEASRLAKIGKGAAKAAGEGAVYGAAEGGGTEENYEDRLKGKAYGAAGGALGGPVGAALGHGVLGAVNIGRSAAQHLGALNSGAEEAAAREFTGKVAGKAEEGKKAAEATIKEADELTKHFEGLSEEQQRDLNHIAELRQQAADRRAQLGGNAPQDFNARRQMVEEMREIREAAQRQGLSPEETNARVVSEAERVALAEAAADGITAAERSRPLATPQEVGAKLQTAAKDIYEHGVAARRQAAGIDKVLKAAGRDNNYTAKSVVDYVDQELPHISNDAERSVLSSFKRKAQGVKEEAAEEVSEILPGETPSQAAARRAQSQEAREAQEAQPGKMSLEKLESLRKDIASALQTRTIALENGNTQAVTTEMAHHLRAVYKRTMQEIADQSPELSSALDRFRKASRPLDEFRTSMKDVIAGDLFTDDFRMGQAMVADKLLSRAKQGQEPIARLVQEKPELKDDLRRLFNYKLFGYGEKTPTPEAYAKFLQQNENALRQSGLFDEFATLGAAKATRKAEVATARAKYEAAERVHEERLAAQEKRAAETKARTERDIKEQAAKREKAEAAVKRYQKAMTNMQSYLREANPEPEKAMKEAGGFLDHMFLDGLIDEAEHADFVAQLRDAEHQYQIHRDAKNFVTRVGNVATATLAAAGLSRFLGLHHLRSLKIF